MSGTPIAVSMGDPCGIGPDIILKAWKASADGTELPNAFVVGDPEVLRKRAEALNLTITIKQYESGMPLARSDAQIPVLDHGVKASGIPGHPTHEDAVCTIKAIDLAVDAISHSLASAVVTCPINKDVLYKAGFVHPGHTEYLGALAEQQTGKRSTPVMMLAGPELRTVPVTIHIPLQDVSEVLTRSRIVETVEIVANDLKDRFGIDDPRIAIAGLNPHAGENGSIGREELEIVVPAVEALKASGISVQGPLPADTMFHASARKAYDVAICMYHDQALIPAKMLGFDDAVNVTLGLPFVRTSPDHGTAYDIAGSGLANPSSFIAAMNLAAEMAERS
ncbi:MAG: 4-hydroxythreonine-4-phosphate dehydrogenase PdxA [Pseudomonadota bacterium]